MATFRTSSGIPTLTGDVERDVALIRDGLYELEEELRYIFSNIGPDNLNETEFNQFLSELLKKLKEG